VRIKSAQDVLSVAQARGLRVKVEPGPPPMPVLVRPHGVRRDEVTDPLLAALRAWRLEIIDLLGPGSAQGAA
jgi:hypothetical protein